MLPLRGGHQWLRPALSSIAAQSAGFDRLWIIDDGIANPHAVAKLAAEIVNGKFEIIPNHGRGISSALNLAVAASRAQWIARMDGDDVSAARRFELQLRWLEGQGDDAVACGTQVRFIDAKGKPLAVSGLPVSGDAIRNQRLRRTCFAHPTLVFRREALVGVPYRSALDGAEDVDLMLRLGEQGTIGNLPEALFDYRLRPTQTNRGYRARQAALQELGFRLALQRERTGGDSLPGSAGLVERFVRWRLDQPGYLAARESLTALRYLAYHVRGASLGAALGYSAQIVSARPWQRDTRRWVKRIARGVPGELAHDPLPDALRAFAVESAVIYPMG
jgi:hypothetical protein